MVDSRPTRQRRLAAIAITLLAACAGPTQKPAQPPQPQQPATSAGTTPVSPGGPMVAGAVVADDCATSNCADRAPEPRADPAWRSDLDHACQTGDHQACLQLGVAWYTAVGGPKDDDVAQDYLGRACDAGVARACALVQLQRPDPDTVFAVAVGDAPVRGAQPAKVTLILATEFACPHCLTVYPMIEDLLRAYPNDLAVVFKHFVVHPLIATYPALAACAAGRQGRLPEMEALLWDKGYKTRDFGEEHVDRLAGEAGLDLARYAEDVAGACRSIIDRDRAELRRLGVRGTPSFFINGRYLAGARPVSHFTDLIEEELAKANQRIANGTPVADYYARWVLQPGVSHGTVTIRATGGRGLLEAVCQDGGAAACYYLAEMWNSGVGGVEDFEKARELYRAACRGGESRGCHPSRPSRGGEPRPGR